MLAARRCCCCSSCRWPSAACASRASITVSPDDRVSGQIVAAAKPRNAEDKGPQLLNNLPFAQKVAVSDYNRDGYVGSQAVFSDLTFAELPQLANMNRDAAGRRPLAAPRRRPGDPRGPRRPDVAQRPRGRRDAVGVLPRRGDVDQRRPGVIRRRGVEAASPAWSAR